MNVRFSSSRRAVASAAASAVALAAFSAAPAAGAPAPVARSASPVSGAFTLELDPASVQATPVDRGTACRLTVSAELAFTGTVQGPAQGRTVATVRASCAAALASPPGTYADTFRYTGTFRGRVSGVPTSAAVDYAGITRRGGEVSALLFLHGSATVLAVVRAQAGVGGTYLGVGG